MAKVLKNKSIEVRMQEELFKEIERYNGIREIEKIEIPSIITDNIKNSLREYQVKCIQYFITYIEQYNDNRNKHLLFNMATGSGKTLMMAGVILYLYDKGYRNFLFFVNSTSIISKTMDNFFNASSIKYLFKDEINIYGRRVEIKEVSNFQNTDDYAINICMTTIQALHSKIYNEKENSITEDDFRDKKIVLIADESHHLNKETKGKKENYDEGVWEIAQNSKPNWENTVDKIFQKHEDNFLLEFTATIEKQNIAVAEKYKSKIIYKYDLIEYRHEKYSKEIEILENDVDQKRLMLGAVILSEYRRLIASDNKINIKPVILFKAHKTIEESKENQEEFLNMIENLNCDDINSLTKNKQKSHDPINEALEYFNKKYNNNINTLIGIIKDSFKIDYLINTNEKEITKSINEKNKKEIEEQAKILNSLESSNNPVRAIFSVNKLNEGWDVLNLFDIVRLHTKRDPDTKNKKAGATTISEAQLIGRGARYYPLNIDIVNKEDIYKRKYDDKINEPKKMLETLYYHSIKDSRYISELKNELRNQGLIDLDYEEKKFELKSEVKEFIEKKNIYLYSNRKVKKTYEVMSENYDVEKKSIEKLIQILNEKEIKYYCATNERKSFAIFKDNEQNVNNETIDISLKILNNLPMHLKLSAWYRHGISFEYFKKSFTKIKSFKEFFESIGSVNIRFYNLTENNKTSEYFNLLDKTLYPIITKYIKENYSEYIGTTEFFHEKLMSVFGKPKIKKVIKDKNGELRNYYSSLVANKEYFAQNILITESDYELDLVNVMDDIVKNMKSVGATDIFLFRNDQELPLYNYSNGRAFYPDFILICSHKQNKMNYHYQIFIEPKGEHLEDKDRWKEDLLLSIEGVVKIMESKHYKIFGMEFYKKSKVGSFKSSLIDKIKEAK